MDAGMIAGPLVFGVLAAVAGHRTGVGAAGIVMIAGALALGRPAGTARDQGSRR
jgi:hypothetical protein